MPFPHVARAERALRLGLSPFALASAWEADHDQTRLSQTALSTWRQYTVFCESWEQDPLPLSVTSIVAFLLNYVLVRGNSSANLNSVASNLRAVVDAHRYPWPDFSADGGDTITRRILKIQQDWPAEVVGAPALTLRGGLIQAIAYLRSFPPGDLWARQWDAILSLMHDMILRPSDIIPLDRFPSVACDGGSPSPARQGQAFAYPRLGDFIFAPPVPPCTLGGLHFRTALSKMQKDRVDYRLCTAAALEIPSAVVNGPRAFRTYLTEARLWGKSADAPVFFYRKRDGQPGPRLSRAALLRELRGLVLSPAGVSGPQGFTLRSLRPGGATDMAAAGVPESTIRKVGKWSSTQGLLPYNRVDHHLLSGLSQFSQPLLSLQS
jgi:hypothetical protein